MAFVLDDDMAQVLTLNEALIEIAEAEPATTLEFVIVPFPEPPIVRHVAFCAEQSILHPFIPTDPVPEDVMGENNLLNNILIFPAEIVEAVVDAPLFVIQQLFRSKVPALV